MRFLMLALCLLAVVPLRAADLPDGVSERLAAMAQAAQKAGRHQVRITGKPGGTQTKPSPLVIGDVMQVAPSDPLAVVQYAKVEFRVSLTTSVPVANFYDPDPKTGIDLSAVFVSPAPESRAWNVKGFWDGSAWRIRFAANKTGTWTYAVSAADASGSKSKQGMSFTCIASSNSGWLGIAGNSFRFSDGNVFWGIGHNTGWQSDVEHPSMEAMAASGENLLSFWLAAPWAHISSASETDHWERRTALEDRDSGGVGHYNELTCAYIDSVIARAEANGIRVLPSIWSHGQLRIPGQPWPDGWWSDNAYSSICTAADFFKTTAGAKDTAQWTYQKNLYRYLIARWGYSTALAGWVGVVELDGTTGWSRNPALAENWCLAVRNYFAANDPYRASAGKYPISFSKLDVASFDIGFDALTTDSYQQSTSNSGIAKIIVDQSRLLRAKNKPWFHAEFGGNIHAGASQPTHLHNGLWAGLAAGAAASPLLWTDLGDYPLLDNASNGSEMLSHYKSLAQFVRHIDYLGAPSLLPVSANDFSAYRAWGMRLNDRGFAWAQDRSGAGISGQSITVAALEPGSYEARWYDTWTDCSIPAQVDSDLVVGANGTLELRTPALAGARPDVAVIFARVVTPTALASAR
jgi:hypothetical protein